MTLTTHALVGAAAASFFPAHPYTAFAAGFVSHFAIDALPHWDYTLRSSRKNIVQPLESDIVIGKDFLYDLASMAFDALLGFVLTFDIAWILHVPLWLAFIGAGAGLYPDLLSFAYFKAKQYASYLAWAYVPVQRFHIFVQWYEWKGEGWQKGIALQMLLVVVVVGLAKIFI